ncbi:M20/M25/M40 family metallo-hydrolase [Erythrobacter sp. KY5]|uniref:M20/M25/M40 family metallo-hydrolase n=1 Tax=Erythrobacter sp. KY5 TaxID=2011159 RepID=UPI0013A6DAA2|nr:M20/M25/M40 family metallo-hydrolase [Erythrobacter sp. KY5]
MMGRLSGRGRLFLICCVSLCIAGCARAPIASVPTAERELIAANLMRDIEVLASPEFGGRKPGTDGEVRTVEFLIDEMQAAGLVSGTNDPGSAWRAPVELVASIPDAGTIEFERNGRDIVPEQGQAAVLTSGRRGLIEDGEMVFVGSEADSIVAEDVTGKVVVMLGEPGVSPRRRATLFESSPAAIITVVDDTSSIEAVSRAYGRERIGLASEEQNQVSAFVTNQVMLGLLGEDRWQSLLGAAQDENFVPIPISATASLDARSQRREFTSYNVIGLLPGAVRGSGAVMLLGHWDHLGDCAPDTPEPICTGAVDNASGIAVMLELTRRLAASGPHDRDIYVLATSAEESGLLGAKAFIAQPSVALEDIVAAFNFDTVAIAPAGTALGFVGEGRTALDETIKQTAAEARRELGNKEFAEQFVRRQDGWAFLEAGVPAVFLSSAFASEIVLGPYLADRYHRPGDKVEGIELGGAIDDLLLHEELVRRVASLAGYQPAP